MSSLYPFQSHFFSTRGQKIHFVDEGQGSPIVMVHGNPTWSFYYRNLILALKSQYRCLALDHIGCGYSSRPSLAEYDFALASRSQDFDAWIDHLQLQQPITLICHDWGGMIGLNWAIHHPEHIQRIVLMNTGGFPLPKSKPLPKRLWIGRNTRIGAWLILKQNMFCRHALRAAMSRKQLSNEVKQMYLQPYDSVEKRLAVLKFVQTIPLKPSDTGWDIVETTGNGLKNLAHLPVLLVWGMKDFVFDQHFLREFQQHFPSAETTEYADAGHYLLEDQEEEVIPRIQTFLEKTDGNPAG